MNRLRFCLVVLVLATGLALPPAARAQACLPFQGIDHCPVGSASLATTPDSDALTVYDLGSGGEDGVASAFAPTTHWAAQMELPSQSAGTSLTFSSISGGEITSQMFLEPVEDGHDLSASFTGASGASTYAALVYLGGKLQGSAGGIESDLGAASGAGPLAIAASGEQRPRRRWRIRIVIGIGYPRPTFSIAPGDGGCNWGLTLDQAGTFELPDGNVVEGDEIRLMEEVEGPGHYPYLGFESIEIRSSAPSFLIHDEFTAATE